MSVSAFAITHKLVQSTMRNTKVKQAIVLISYFGLSSLVFMFAVDKDRIRLETTPIVVEKLNRASRAQEHKEAPQPVSLKFEGGYHCDESGQFGPLCPPKQM